MKSAAVGSVVPSNLGNGTRASLVIQGFTYTVCIWRTTVVGGWDRLGASRQAGGANFFSQPASSVSTYQQVCNMYVAGM